MNPQILAHYNRELQFLREMGSEFAEEYPKIAGRLGIEGFECADPYVERLLEGFAFLTARIQLKLEAEYPRFTQHLLEMVYPHYLAPTPSMAVVQLNPDMTQGSLGAGYVVPRDTILRSPIFPGGPPSCEYRTAHAVTLWPIRIEEAEYTVRDLPALGLPEIPDLRAAFRWRLRTTNGTPFAKLPLDRLTLHLRGSDELPLFTLQQLTGAKATVMVRPVGRSAPWQRVGLGTVDPVGFGDGEAILPGQPGSFRGYRLLQEYFAFADRFLFVEIAGLRTALERCADSEVEIVVALDRAEPRLDGAVDSSHFALFCTPAVNLFPHRADRIHLSRQMEHHVVPDRTRPLDFEVHSLEAVTGYGTRGTEKQPFEPFYSCDDFSRQSAESTAYYSVQRRPRRLSARERKDGTRSSYVGSEVFLSLVDPHHTPYSGELRQLEVLTLCTNRDLPLQIPVGKGATDFVVESGAPIESIRCVAGPTPPRPSAAHGEMSWRLINHLSLNYLSLVDTDRERGATALRELLALYGDTSEPYVRRQIEGIRSIASRSVVRRAPSPGPIAFARGLEIVLTCEESAFEGTGLFLLGAVLERFFARYVSINSFTETVLRTVERGEVMRWPARIGQRPTL